MRDNKQSITAFHGVFEQKISRIVKTIKKIRKDPNEKSRVKELLTEAKALKKLINTGRKKPTQYSIEIPISVVDGQIQLAETSAKTHIKILDTRLVGGLLVVEFNILD